MSDRRNNRRNRTLELGVILLIHEIFKLGVNHIPPVTLITVISQTLLYIGVIDVSWDKYDVCISGYKVWAKQDYKSLLLSSFEHATDTHLYYNMISFLVKGRTLENKHGSVNFALLLIFLCVATPVMYICLALLSSSLLEDNNIMKSCAIGFSGVIFALKLITTVEEEGYSYVGGFRVPLKYSAWVELIAIHMLVPNASFMGHLAGVLVGFIYIKTFVGSIIDKIITSISGQRMFHRRSGGSTSRQSNYSNSYNEYYQDENFSSNSFNTHQSPPGYFYDYNTRPADPPGWRF